MKIRCVFAVITATFSATQFAKAGKDHENRQLH
jgi:hypothetical protein